MTNPTPQPLSLQGDDRDFLIGIARTVLGNSPVAATTAAGLIKQGVDTKRVNTLIPWSSVAVKLDGYVFKKVEADQESPENFGLFVRRRVDSAPPFNPARSSTASSRS